MGSPLKQQKQSWPHMAIAFWDEKGNKEAGKITEPMPGVKGLPEDHHAWVQWDFGEETRICTETTWHSKNCLWKRTNFILFQILSFKDLILKFCLKLWKPWTASDYSIFQPSTTRTPVPLFLRWWCQVKNGMTRPCWVSRAMSAKCVCNWRCPDTPKPFCIAANLSQIDEADFLGE